MRPLLIAALLATGCSYTEEVADIFVHVDGIAQDADHLEVIVTPSDTSVTGKNNCAPTVLSQPSATCYRPSFQPVDATEPLRAIDLAFVAPAKSGTFTLNITAYDRTQVAHGVGASAGTLPGPVNLQVTLH